MSAAVRVLGCDCKYDSVCAREREREGERERERERAGKKLIQVILTESDLR